MKEAIDDLGKAIVEVIETVGEVVIDMYKQAYHDLKVKFGLKKVYTRDIQAWFIGEPGSNGFRYGKLYTLTIRRAGTAYYIEDIAGNHRCRYTSSKALRENWRVINASKSDWTALVTGKEQETDEER